MSDFKFIYIEEVLFMHDTVILNDGGCAGVRDVSLLKSALQRPVNLSISSPESSAFDLAAYLIHGLIQTHPFLDGNKRTAMLAGLILLKRNNAYNDTAGIAKLEEIALKVCACNFSENDIAEQLRSLFTNHS